MNKKKITFSFLKYVSLGLVLLNIIFTIFVFNNSVLNFNSIWSAANFMSSKTELACAISIVLFCVNIILLILGTIFTLKKNNIGVLIYSIGNLFIHIVLIVLLVEIINTIVFLIINIVIAVIAVISSMLYLSKNKNIKDDEVNINHKVPKLAILILALIGLVVFIAMFFIPIVRLKSETQSINIIIADGISKKTDVYTRILFVGYLLFFISIFVYLVNAVMYYRNYEKIFAEKIKSLINVYFATGLIIFIACYLMTIINSYVLVFGSFLPFILMVILKVLYSIFRGKYIVVEENYIRKSKSNTVEPTLYLAVISIITTCLLFVKVIEVEYSYSGRSMKSSYNGLDLIQSYKNLGSGYQVFAFVILAVILISLVTFILSLCAYFAKYKDYHKITKTSIYVNVILLSVLGLSGFYFKIAQKINEENILSLLSELGIMIPLEYVIDIRSQMFLLAVPAIAVLVIAMFRGKLIPAEEPVLSLTNENDNSHNLPVVNENPIPNLKQNVDFDSCPVFTELDSKKEQYDLELKEKEKFSYENPTLPSLVDFIVEYACESRLHLSYKKEDIATFIAGLGASRLTILQGMSGTGKTSLPKIFTEAIFGNCEIVEVESSWRDKNELLGYYNEFSKSYSPKKFTQKLYKAKLNPNIITFIVLDEMNLSRIEYYFSDFLSLMENEEDKREIKLLNVKLDRTENNHKYSYIALEEGHTIKIPTNVWFIGTANRDESTFEISDKVYDRAQTMNFNRRAPKARPLGKNVPQKYLSYDVFSNLLKSAIKNGSFEAEENEIIKEVEKILQPFNISFGNRVLKQIEEFVNIYCACFDNSDEVLKEAIEKILLSKVVAKLEFKNVDNKDKLAKQFNKLNLDACSEFVSKLNED